MSLLSECDLIIFDCDGVLIDSETLGIASLTKVLQQDGVPATIGMINACFGLNLRDTLARVAELTGHEVPPATADKVWPAARLAFEQALQPTDGIESFLHATRTTPRCVASSSHPERIAYTLALTGLREAFGPHLFSATQVARGKPEPDLFLHAAESMNAVPERCIVIEDSRYGIAAACAAGMTAIGYTGASHVTADHANVLSLAGATAVLPDWAGLLSYVDKNRP